MIRLDTTSTKLQTVLAAAVTTNALQITANYSDHTAAAYTGGTQRSTSNNTTDVDSVSAPGASTVRDIDYFTVYNADTVAATVTVKIDVSGTEHILIKTTLATGETLEYVHGTGWKVLTTAGAAKTSGSPTTGSYILYSGTATAGQTSLTATYTPGAVEVFVNGVRLLESEYTATTGSAVVVPALALNDEWVVKAWNVSGLTSAITYSNMGKNAIINGAFEVWQRGTSFAAIATSAYFADRWHWVNTTAGAVTASRSTTIPTVAEAGVLAPYSALVDCTTADASVAAGDVAYVGQYIEGYVWRNFAQRALTLSFWVRATKTGTYCVALRNANTPDRSFVAEYTVSAADTWEKKTINITASPSAGTWDYTTGIGASLAFVLMCGSTFQTTAGAWQSGNYVATSNQVNALDSTSNDFRLALVQLEVGDYATTYEIQAFGDELMRCRRYWQQTYAMGVAAGTVTNTGALIINAAGTAAGSASTPHPLVPPMRIAPTLTFYSPTSGASGNWRRATGAADVTYVMSLAASEFQWAGSNSGTCSDGEQIYGHVTMNAELT